jgi:hypothetical protein
MTETLFSLGQVAETPREWRTEKKGSPDQIAHEEELSWDMRDALLDDEVRENEDDERFLNDLYWEEGPAADDRETMEEDLAQDAGKVYTDEAWNISQGLMRAGLKDTSRLATRKANRTDQEKPRTRVVLEFSRGAVIWGHPTPTVSVHGSPSTDYRRKVPVTRASGELTYVRPSRS